MNRTILFSDNSLWGCLNFRSCLIEQLVRLDYKVVLVAPNDSFVAVEVPQGVVYEPISMDRTGSNPLKDMAYMIRLRAIYKRHKPAVAFHYTIKPNIYGTFAAKMLGIPSVAVVTGLGYVFTNKGFANKIAQCLYSWALKMAHHALFLNQENFRELVDRKMVQPENATLLQGGEGIDMTVFQETPIPIHEKLLFLMIGRVLYDKGYNEFVAAAQANPEARFQLIGAIDTNPKAVLADVVAHEKAIEYLGFMTHEKVLQHIAQSSCVVLPSYHEGMSVTLIESIALGRPIICSDIAGCRETVDEGVNGFLVPPKDGVALATACQKFITLSAQERQEMANQSRKKAEQQFDVQQVWTVYKKLIDSLIEQQ